MGKRPCRSSPLGPAPRPHWPAHPPIGPQTIRPKKKPSGAATASADRMPAFRSGPTKEYVQPAAGSPTRTNARLYRKRNTATCPRGVSKRPPPVRNRCRGTHDSARHGTATALAGAPSDRPAGHPPEKKPSGTRPERLSDMQAQTPRKTFERRPLRGDRLSKTGERRGRVKYDPPEIGPHPEGASQKRGRLPHGRQPPSFRTDGTAG